MLTQMQAITDNIVSRVKRAGIDTNGLHILGPDGTVAPEWGDQVFEAGNYPGWRLVIEAPLTEPQHAAVAAAMGNMGFTDIRTDATAGIVEGVATSFWFGFKDDVIARIGANEIDFRSVSRVGRSDLGANAKRIAELRTLVADQIGQR